MGWIVWISFSYVSYTKLKNLFYHSRIKLRICISSKSYKSLKEVIGSDQLFYRTKYAQPKDLNYKYFFKFLFLEKIEIAMSTITISLLMNVLESIIHFSY